MDLVLASGEVSNRPLSETLDRTEPPSSRRRRRWHVVILHCPDTALVERQFELTGTLTIGRDAGAVNLPIDDGRLSRRHATLRGVFDQHGALLRCEVEDDGSRNGTYVDARRVQRQELRPGAIVRIGDTVLEVSDAAEEGPAPEATGLIAKDPVFAGILRQIDRIAASNVRVLVLGETGCGKELVARRLHEESGRQGAFVPVNCGAIPGELAEATLFGHVRGAFTGATTSSSGLFARAEGGTLFLDEVGELPLDQQPKLLRVLEDGLVTPVGGSEASRVDVRIVAATNADLRHEATAGTFRPDLLARLSGYVVELPPLRQRKRDILPLAYRYLREHAPQKHFVLTASFVEGLLLHPWPLNIRELSAAMRRLALQEGDELRFGREDLGLIAAEAPVGADPTSMTTPPATPTPDDGARQAAQRRTRGPTREELAAELAKTGGNVSHLARHYGKDAKQIYRWLERHQLDPRDFRTPA